MRRKLSGCLESARPLVDYALVVDTGSTDGTQQTIREFMQSTRLSGEIIEEPWRDFAYNRTFALAKLRQRAAIDYSLMIDADQTVVFDNGFDVANFKDRLRSDIYDVTIESGNVQYLLPQLTRNEIDISYRGVLHEFRECPEGCSRDIARGLVVREIQDSARSQNKRKYAEHAVILEKALSSETEPFLFARYKFYLAQSYRDAGDPERALNAYLERTTLGIWDEEVAYSFYAAAKLKELLRHPEDEIIKAYLQSYRTLAIRAEALHVAARFCRTIERFEQGYEFAKKALNILCPQTGFLVERWIYDYGLLDEFAVLAFMCSQYSESLGACARILTERKIPEDQRDRILKNAHAAIEKL